MLKAIQKRTLTLLALCISFLILFTSCTEQNEIELPVLEDYYTHTTQSERSKLKLGVVIGPYGDMFLETIEPLLSQKGYSVELISYNNYAEPNFALANGEIDFNMFQNYKYLNNFKFENNLNLSAIAEIPTAAMGIYSYSYDSIEDIKNGAVVSIPSDSTNLSRALAILDGAGLISLGKYIDISKITVKDITENPKNLQFVPMEAHLLAETLADYDLAVINGNYALSGGLNPSGALFNETLNDHGFLNVIAVRLEDLGEPFVMDLIAVLDSAEFKDSIIDADGKYSDFQYPCNFKTNTY